MERPSFLPRSKSNSFSTIWSGQDEKYSLLAFPVHQKPKLRVRNLIGHCLYRRVILWTVAVLSLVCLIFSAGHAHFPRRKVLDLAEFRKVHAKAREDDENYITFVVQKGGDNSHDEQERPKWLQFRHLDGYFNGLIALVPVKDHVPEYPRNRSERSPFPVTVSYTGIPAPTPYIPQPDYSSDEYTKKHYEVQPCYLGKDETVPVPDTYAFYGVVQGQPKPVIGSHSLLGLRDDICFDRFGRYGPYGLGYGFSDGGLEVGMETEQEGSETVWAKTGKINYNGMDWGDAQQRCYESNKKRFVSAVEEDCAGGTSDSRSRLSRTAIVVRTYVGVDWAAHVIVNFRAMISELALRSGGEYQVHFLLHVRDDDIPIWADETIAQQVLAQYVPEEFHSICTLWSEAQMRLLYPGDFGASFSDPSHADIHGVYRSAHMPLQHFAMQHAEYAHFWNWEMDMRWIGNYYELFDRLGAWARQQTRIEAWERSEKYYIPYFHGSWDNFTRLVHNETYSAGRRSILGPVDFDGRQPTRAEQAAQTFLPSTCYRAHTSDDMWNHCGVGEDADLITLNPIFDTDESDWMFAEDVTGYDKSLPIPPRRCAIITASRLSRRLLEVMHEETWRMHHAMFSEMFPASMALHHGLKAVYAPHPVYLDREWDMEAVDAAFNGGRNHTASGRGSPFGFDNEHNHKGTSWYYHSEFAGLLWRRWLGYAQMDGRGEHGGTFGDGTLRGGRAEEESREGTGRLCLQSRLVHPIKWEDPAELL
ncbi:hypothetical protein QBC47DRAFT_448920 [Echria macrotheca]|uniref:Major facilitator superfamily transporter n=1 Tax=Echria macrotheca TaxID=438768 RepID=A0AAJ0BLK8_9PEZI|nr:hypothetical protein QBC47DRAFT_448920 [Echria macrotheca]